MLVLALGLVGLAIIFLFQQTDFYGGICGCHHGQVHFSVNKTLRVLVNDFCMLAVIHAWFHDSKITRLAFWIQLVDTLILLPLYLIIKLSFEGDNELSSPLLSQLHRLIINPTLMILIFPAVYFQRFQRHQHS